MNVVGVPSSNTKCRSTNPVVLETAAVYGKIAGAVNTDAASIVETSKNLLSIERMSPVSVDSGFDSSFPSSPDCSLDSPISSASTDSAEITKPLKKSNLKQQHRTKITTAAVVALPHDDVAVVPQCSLSLCGSSCSPSSSLPMTRTSSNISTFSAFSTTSLIRTDTKAIDDYCIDICLLEKTASLVSALSSSSALLQSTDDVQENQDLKASLTPASSGSNTVPLRECLTIPSSSTRLLIDANKYVDLKIRCQWKNCSERFACDNDLYDHVVEAHLLPLRPLGCSTGANCSTNDISSGNGGSQSPTKGRQKNLMCQWGSCKMGISRGDAKKQYRWLAEHFTTRHAGKAQPYMCLFEGCSSRFTLKRLLEEHLRTGHEKAKILDDKLVLFANDLKNCNTAKRPHIEEGELSRAKSCYQWTPMPYYIPSEKNDFLDCATEEWIVMRLREYERTSGACFVPREPTTPRGGAAYRKKRRLLTFAIEPFKISPKVDKMEVVDAKKLLRSAFINT